jgi:hypothetical protein
MRTRGKVSGKVVTSISLERDLYLEIKKNEINLTQLVENFLRSYFSENLDEVEVLKQIEQKKLELSVLEEKKKNLVKDRAKKDEFEKYMKIYRGNRKTTPEFMVRKEYKHAVDKLGYKGTWEDWNNDIGRPLERDE